MEERTAAAVQTRAELLAVNHPKGPRKGGRRRQPENSMWLLQSMCSSEARRRSLENWASASDDPGRKSHKLVH
jgi:hypothetical protein